MCVRARFQVPRKTFAVVVIAEANGLRGSINKLSGALVAWFAQEL